MCVCVHVRSAVVLVPDLVIWSGWDVDKKHSTKKQSITIAGCNFQLIGAQWCLSGAEQTETFAAIPLAHLHVNVALSTPFHSAA